MLNALSKWTYFGCSIRSLPKTATTVQIRRNPTIAYKIRTAETIKHLRSELLSAASFTAKEWETFAQRLLDRSIFVPGTHVSPANVESVIMRLCDEHNLFDTGQNYFEYLKSKKGTLNNSILSRYLSLCSSNRNFCLENKSHIIAIYNQLASSQVVEPLLAERCVKAVCLFEDYWKDAFSLLERVKLSTEATPSMYYAIVEACFTFGDIQTGWDLFRSVAGRQPPFPPPNCYLAYVDYCKREKESGRFTPNLLDELFEFMDEYHLPLPDLGVVDALEKLVFSLSDDTHRWSLKETYIPKNGVCSNCRNRLEKPIITSEEFEHLCRMFVKKAVIGTNVFLKSTPQEIEMFMKFLAKAKPYDIVIDGLNVAFASGKRSVSEQAFIVKTVVEHFVKKRKKVVVLGRRHMAGWPEAMMGYIFKNANVFLAMDLTHDDPLLLYAALKGGENTFFVSRDFMRTHLFALEDDKTKLLFRKWLSSHQYKLGHFYHGKHNIIGPVPFRLTAQKLPSLFADWCWHVPYNEKYAVAPTDTRELPSKWICVRRQKIDKRAIK